MQISFRNILYNYFKHENPVANFANLLNTSRITIADGYTKYISNIEKRFQKMWKEMSLKQFNTFLIRKIMSINLV